MKKNLLDKAAAESIIERISRLNASQKANWGDMNASEMLLHCNICNRQILEEGRGNKSTTVKQYLLRILALYIAPGFKKGIKGESKNDTLGKARPEQFEELRNEFIALIRRFPENKQPLTLTHTAFGNISTNQWGIAAYKHMDHHLRQFGV